MIVTRTLNLNTKGNLDIINITREVERALSETALNNGTITVFVAHTTCGLTIMEYEPGLISDFKKMCERLVPDNIPYAHDRQQGDDNGYAHNRTSLIGCSIVIPFTNKKMMLGTWQQVVLVDFDVRPRSREIVLQFAGE